MSPGLWCDRQSSALPGRMAPEPWGEIRVYQQLLLGLCPCFPAVCSGISAAALVGFSPSPPLCPVCLCGSFFLPAEPRAGEQKRPCPEPDPPAELLGGTEAAKAIPPLLGELGSLSHPKTSAQPSGTHSTELLLLPNRSFPGINCSDPFSREAAELRPEPKP